MNGADVIGVGIMGLAVLTLPVAFIAWLVMRGGEKQFILRAHDETGVVITRNQAAALLQHVGGVTEQRVDEARVMRYDRAVDAISVTQISLPEKTAHTPTLRPPAGQASQQNLVTLGDDWVI